MGESWHPALEAPAAGVHRGNGDGQTSGDRRDPGERALLFLNADEDGAMHVAHLSLGAFHLELDPETGASSVVRQSFGTSVSPVTGEVVTSRADHAS